MKPILDFFQRIRQNGVNPEMDGYARGRLAIFNLINFFGLITGLFIPLAALLGDGYLPPIAWIVACSPAFISLGVLLSHYYQRHTFALLWYFTLYPLVTALVYLNSIDAGIELFFIFYGVLGVFFLQQVRYLVASIGFSMFCFVGVYLVKREYTFVMADINYSFFVLNHLIALLFIFGGLFLIKRENLAFQAAILQSHDELFQYSVEMEKQKEELAELNQIKTKMFSVISHDVRLPLYSLRNIFQTMRDFDMPADKIKELLPEVVKDLSQTTDLLENLLQWAKSQMAGESIQPVRLDITSVVDKILSLLNPQATAKEIRFEFDQIDHAYAWADRSMLETVIRNLVSNAVKFTPLGGTISVELMAFKEHWQIAVSDTGVGMDAETCQRIFANQYYSTSGTANEGGTGLGLMICKEFVRKNGGELAVRSIVGEGTTFYFSLPKAAGSTVAQLIPLESEQALEGS